MLSKMLELAMKWEIRTDNPARGIERAPEEKRERFLTPADKRGLARCWLPILRRYRPTLSACCC